MTANWKTNSSNRWTVPVGGGIGRIFKIGNQAVNAKLEAYYNVEKSDGAPDYSVAFEFSFLLPK